MSISSIQSQIESTQRGIQSLQRRLTDKTKQESDKTSRIAQIQRSITRSTSVSSLESKQREIQRLNDDIARLQSDKASLTKQIGDKTERLHRSQQDLFREQQREQKRFQSTLERQRRLDEQRQRDLLANVGNQIAGTAAIQDGVEEFDAFISNASEDKEEVARPLAETLRSHGYRVWYDEFSLKVGDSLRRSIDRGLAACRFGIVILSPSFFAKNWPQYEVDGLVAKEMQGGKVVLPLWHKVSKNEVIRYSPTLADKVALNTALHTVDELAEQLSEVLGEPRHSSHAI